MKRKYLSWINEHYPTSDSAVLQCDSATLKMIKIFPELKRVRGQINVKEPRGLLPTKCPHWWLIAEDNTIVDPVAHQYPLGIEKYIQWDESLGNPTGRCINCGDLCSGGVCSERCEKAMLSKYRYNSSFL